MIGNIAAGLYGVGVTPSTTSFESIATTSLTSAQSLISFDTSSLSAYKHLQIRYMARSARTSDVGATMVIRFNSDSGNNYAYHILYGDGSSAAAYNGSSTNVTRSYSVASSSSSNTDIYGVGVVDILDFRSTSKYKTLRHLGGYDRNGSGELNLASGLWQSTNAITSVDFSLVEATANYEVDSHFALYGIKD